MSNFSDIKYPEKNEICVATIGTSHAFGESIVLHLGNDVWYIIDSCIDCNGIILPLKLLEDIGVDKEKVLGVVCTHWHSDHILGLSTILKECINSHLIIPNVGQKKSFIKYIVNKDAKVGPTGIWHEFVEALKSIGGDKTRLEYASHDTMIYEDVQSDIKLFGLSPSDNVFDVFYQKIVDSKGNLDLIPDDVPDPNMCSLSICLSTSNFNVLLGADLETNRSNRYVVGDCVNNCINYNEDGWCSMFEKGVSFKNRQFDCIKLPHHSSITGFCPKLWTDKIIPDNIKLTSRFLNKNGDILPQKDMLELYHSLSGDYYITTKYIYRKSKKTPEIKQLKKEVGIDAKSTVSVRETYGVIVCKRFFNEDKWRVDTIHDAYKIDDEYVENYEYKYCFNL